MSKVSYANLKLKVDTSIDTFDFGGQTIEVLKYLPIKDKYDLVMITLQKSLEEEMYNPIKLDWFFHLHLVYMYTNLSFTDKQREDELKLYDCLKSSGFIDKLLTIIDENEYREMLDFIDQIVLMSTRYKNSAAAILTSLITDLPNQMQKVADIADDLDLSQFKEVVNFAKAANGGRPVPKE